MQRQALPTRRVDRDPILALVILKGDVGLPLALEVALLGGDPVGGAEERVATQVLVAVLHKTKAGLVPDEPVVEQFLKSGVDVALALEQLIPLRNAA